MVQQSCYSMQVKPSVATTHRGAAGRFLRNARDLCEVRRVGGEQCWQELVLYADENAGVGEWQSGAFDDAHCRLAPTTCRLCPPLVA